LQECSFYLSSDNREITREFAIKFIEKKIKKTKKIKLSSLEIIFISIICNIIIKIQIRELIKNDNFKLKKLKNFSSHSPLYKPNCFALKLAKRPSIKN
jgi:hypothetical protein